MRKQLFSGFLAENYRRLTIFRTDPLKSRPSSSFVPIGGEVAGRNIDYLKDRAYAPMTEQKSLSFELSRSTGVIEARAADWPPAVKTVSFLRPAVARFPLAFSVFLLFVQEDRIADQVIRIKAQRNLLQLKQRAREQRGRRHQKQRQSHLRTQKNTRQQLPSPLGHNDARSRPQTTASSNAVPGSIPQIKS